MITQDEIDSSVLLLGDQQYNWKLLSQKWFHLQPEKHDAWGPDLVSFRFESTVAAYKISSFHRSTGISFQTQLLCGMNEIIKY